MAKRDFYEVLGVAKDAGADDLKKAFRKLAMQHHPDRNPGDASAEQKFREVNEAYDVLKDEQKRAAYDRFGHAAFEQGGGARPGGNGGFEFNFGGGGGFADIFDEMFGEFMGGRRGAGGAGRGADLRYNMEITLEDAHRGKQSTIRVASLGACEACSGSGAEKGAKPVTCTTCRGHGKVRSQQGFFTVERGCPTCAGRGQTIDKPCRACSGEGRVRRERSLSVSIPAGVDDGTRIRLAGEGEAGSRGGPAGDLYIFLSVSAHDLFRRDGNDLHVRVPIPMTTAALGGAIEVPSIDGSRSRVNIPAGTQSSQAFRLRGKGMAVLRSQQRGDLFVETAIETPVNLTKRQQELLREFEKAGTTEKTSPESAGFFSKVKELWDDLRD
ncbi:MAG: molecular chaperone DnaJ [Alphaproteobacteria bacterium]|jgi:molecular chaperone DnaJ